MGKGEGNELFQEVSVLALVDQLIKGCSPHSNRTLFNVMQAVPIPALEGLASIVQRIVTFSLTYIDESVIAYTFRTKMPMCSMPQNQEFSSTASHGNRSLKCRGPDITELRFCCCYDDSLHDSFRCGCAVPSSLLGIRKVRPVCAGSFLGISAKWILFDPLPVPPLC